MCFYYFLAVRAWVCMHTSTYRGIKNSEALNCALGLEEMQLNGGHLGMHEALCSTSKDPK